VARILASCIQGDDSSLKRMAPGAPGAAPGCDNCGGCGVVYRLDTAGHETVLYSFTGGADADKRSRCEALGNPQK